MGYRGDMKIVSGGQSGADRGAIDAALEAGNDWGGWIPKDRKVEDGRIPDHYDRFTEHPSPDYQPRTWSNVRDSDATVIFTTAPASPGCRLTMRACHELEKPFVVLSVERALGSNGWSTYDQLSKWLKSRPEVNTLNVAGTRESRAPGLQATVHKVLAGILKYRESGRLKVEAGR